MADQIFTIIVADDEEDLLEAVCAMVPWEEIGFRLIGSAGNGLDALQMVEQLQPDLLLTDIQMPFITGTALARQVRELQPMIHVAFLSGYDDFEYARSAIDNQVVSYLLKPISMQRLTEALREIHGKMEARLNDLRPKQTGSSLSLTVASLLLDSFAEQPEEDLRNALRDGGLNFYESCEAVVLAMRAGRPDQGAALLADQVLRKYYGCCSFASGGRILSLLISEDGFAGLNTALDELYYAGRRLLSEDCVIGVSRSYHRLDRCAAACREAVDTQRMAEESGIYHTSRIQARVEERLQDEQGITAELVALLIGGSRRSMEQFLQRCFSENDSHLGALQLLITVQGVFRRSLEESELDLLMRDSGLEDPMSAGLDRDELQRRVSALCIAGMERLRENRKEGVSYLCEQALHIIEQRYMDEDLSLSAVSEQLHVSPNYLSANMKKYVGDTFINLLIRRRMEAALTLIQGGGLKIAEVAKRCGYGDQHYFSYCFKKFYGVSPVRMRRGEADA